MPDTLHGEREQTWPAPTHEHRLPGQHAGLDDPTAWEEQQASGGERQPWWNPRINKPWGIAIVGLALLMGIRAGYDAWQEAGEDDRAEHVETMQDLGLTESQADEYLSAIEREEAAADIDLSTEDSDDGVVSDVELVAVRGVLRAATETLPGMETFDEAAWSDAEIRAITGDACAAAADATSAVAFDMHLVELWATDTMEVGVHKSMIAGAGMSLACSDAADRINDDRVQQRP